MLRHAAIRIVQGAVSLFLFTLVLFLLVRLTGDPVAVLVPPDVPPEMIESVRSSLHLDRTLDAQYLSYLEALAHGDLGVSMRLGTPVASLIADRFANTLRLGLLAMLLTFGTAIPLGVYSAARVNREVDWIGRILAVLGQSFPPFWLGILAIWLFAGILPIGGGGSLQHLILPAVTLSFALSAGLIRITRSAMLDALETDYVKMVRLKGMPEWRVLWIHALRNAGVSISTFGGIVAITLLTGSVVVETVFAWPGLGRLLIESASSRDFPVVQGVALVFASMYVIGNLMIDLLYVYLNPEITV